MTNEETKLYNDVDVYSDLSPSMQQYYDLKKDYSDSILFFRMGDFYEMFDDDAYIANKVLGIAITSRNKNSLKPTPLAGIPFHAKDKYLPQLIEAGYKVAIAEQVSDPKLKGLARREVVRVVTPSTISFEGENYENNISANIIAITAGKNKYGISIVDFSLNKWLAFEFPSFEELQDELYKLSPREIIVPKALFTNKEIKDTLEKKFSLNIYLFDPKQNPYAKLTNHCHTINLHPFGIENMEEAQKACALIIEYLEHIKQYDFSLLNSISVLDLKDNVKLDEATIKNLDLIYNLATKSSKDGTLFGVLNKTKTTSGSNMLLEAILKPLTNKGEIEKRLDFVHEFLRDKVLLDKTERELRGVSNISLIMNRIALNRTSPRDLINLKNSLISIQNIINLINESENNILKDLIK